MRGFQKRDVHDIKDGKYGRCRKQKLFLLIIVGFGCNLVQSNGKTKRAQNLNYSNESGIKCEACCVFSWKKGKSVSHGDLQKNKFFAS